MFCLSCLSITNTISLPFPSSQSPSKSRLCLRLCLVCCHIRWPHPSSLSSSQLSPSPLVIVSRPFIIVFLLSSSAISSLISSHSLKPSHILLAFSLVRVAFGALSKVTEAHRSSSEFIQTYTICTFFLSCWFWWLFVSEVLSARFPQLETDTDHPSLIPGLTTSAQNHCTQYPLLFWEDQPQVCL